MARDIIIDDDQKVVSIALPEVPNDGKATLGLQKSWLLTSFIPGDIVTLLLGIEHLDNCTQLTSSWNGIMPFWSSYLNNPTKQPGSRPCAIEIQIHQLSMFQHLLPIYRNVPNWLL